MHTTDARVVRPYILAFRNIRLIILLLPAAAEIVVMDLDAEYDGRRYCRDGVGDDQRPVDGVAETSLHNEKYAAKAHKQEGGEGDGIGVAGADGVYGLRHVAQHHADGCQIAEDFKQCHSKRVSQQKITKLCGRAQQLVPQFSGQRFIPMPKRA